MIMKKGTPVEDQKKGKTKWEVATGHSFLGLVYYDHRKLRWHGCTNHQTWHLCRLEASTRTKV